MRNRSIKKQVWLDENENERLKIKCRKAGISESTYFRNCIKDVSIKEKPDENFYQVLKDLRGIAININQLAQKANINAYYYDERKYYPLSDEIKNIVESLKEFYL